MEDELPFLEAARRGLVVLVGGEEVDVAEAADPERRRGAGLFRRTGLGGGGTGRHEKREQESEQVRAAHASR